MEKLFISCPMRARTAEQIHATMDQMHKIAEAIFGEELEVKCKIRWLDIPNKVMQGRIHKHC